MSHKDAHSKGSVKKLGSTFKNLLTITIISRNDYNMHMYKKKQIDGNIRF